MTFGFTRDSALLWLGGLAALLAYLAVNKPPTAWTYAEWLQFGIALCGYVLGKLSTSPLPHSEEGDLKVTTSGR